MRGKLASILLLVALIAGCQQPPAYVSHYTAPPSAAQPVPPQTMASFIDTFDRPDGGLGEGWDMRGPYVHSFPLPPAADGFIRDGHYTYAGNVAVYATRQFRAPVQRIGATGRWTQTRDGAETTMAMAITANSELVTNMVHFTANRAGWNLTVRRGKGFEPVASGAFTPILALDTDYRFELEAHDGTVTVRVPGSEVTKPVDLTGIVGDRAFWEEYPPTLPAGVVFDYDTVWAAEQGQPLQPVS